METAKPLREIGAFICNYNKADFVVKCVQALKEQTYGNLDILVVDNASTDQSVEMLQKQYGDSITILQNEENLGGCGGFGRAIRTALAMGYRYFMLVDNDAFLDRQAVEYLHDYMEAHEDVGICGAETLYLQEPDRIQDLGGRLDLESYQLSGISGGMKDRIGRLILECDYVASCAVLARTEAVRRFGGFPEDNFIYWDDVEWCTKCRQAGYKVIVIGHAKAYHDLSGANVRNMFLRYYANRNRYYYFLKYLPEDKLEDFYQFITGEFFSRNYGAMNKGKYGTVFTEWNALDDFMHGIKGKAAEGKIVPYVYGEDRLTARIRESKSALIYMPDRSAKAYGYLNRLLSYLTDNNNDMEIRVVFRLEECQLQAYGLVLQMCDHVTKVKENILPVIYVDPWRNCIMDTQDYWYYSNYDLALKNFRDMYRPLFLEQKKRIRSCAQEK